jgi:hypothetical protein
MTRPAGGPGWSGRKLVLAIIDALKPAMLERAIATGRAPTLAALRERGAYVPDCVAAFPSVTPTCAATIATGAAQDAHHIPSMNWFHRAEARYVEYGSSFAATRAFGIVRSMTDTVYNMNAVHLSAHTPTVFETLDDAEVRTAGTTYLMYRGRYRHEVSTETSLARVLLPAGGFRDPVYGPRELFYADVFASRRTGCRGQLGLPGVRDQHTGCVGAYLVEHDLFDFLLFSLPDNDSYSHKHGPHAQVTSIAEADRQLERLVHAAGGLDAFLAEHAIVVAADHSHSAVERSVALPDAFAQYAVLTPGRARGEGREPEVAVCPAQRSAMVYVLDPERRARLLGGLVRTALGMEGADLVAHAGDGEAVVRSARGELRFAPADGASGAVRDGRGETWNLEGELAVLGATVSDGELAIPDYPDALARLWAAVTCETSGDVLISAAPGYEFRDWGGAAHVGGGSHGSLHASDSLGALLWCGTGPSDPAARTQWTLRDIAPMVLGHFGLA